WSGVNCSATRSRVIGSRPRQRRRLRATYANCMAARSIPAGGASVIGSSPRSLMVIGVLRTCVVDWGAFFTLVRRLCDMVLITAAPALHVVHVLEDRIARPLPHRLIYPSPWQPETLG